jgi:hypothetical protein
MRLAGFLQGTLIPDGVFKLPSERTSAAVVPFPDGGLRRRHRLLLSLRCWTVDHRWQRGRDEICTFHTSPTSTYWSL